MQVLFSRNYLREKSPESRKCLFINIDPLHLQTWHYMLYLEVYWIFFFHVTLRLGMSDLEKHSISQNIKP